MYVSHIKIHQLQSLNKNPEFIKHTTQRYHTYSDWDHTREELVKVAKVGLLFLFLRELPLRHFHARAFVIGVTGYYLAYKHWGYFVDKASHYYLNDRDERFFENYPLIKELVTKRIENKSPSPVAAESDMWWKGHQPVFYHHHFKHWRYVMRNRREIQWDGTFNQPIFPFMQCNDRTAFVHNGVNENVVPGASGNW